MSNQFKMAQRLLELGLDKASVANDGKTALMHGNYSRTFFIKTNFCSEFFSSRT
jgi:hypothetical protein